MNISENIKRLRNEHDWTLEELAEKVGTSKQNISRYETGQTAKVPYDKILKLADVFGVSPGVLMGWEDNRKSYQLTDDEEQIIKAYRDASQVQRLLAYAQLIGKGGDSHDENMS